MSEEKKVEEVEKNRENVSVETKELTEEEKVVQEEANKKELEGLERQKKYAEALQCGALFLKFVINDQKPTYPNRHARRRAEKGLKSGIITKDLIDAYENRIGEIVTHFNEQVELKKNPPVHEVKPVETKEETKEDEK
jgi:hypothetical protein